MEKLSGKTALVTGSTDGVGRLVARKLALWPLARAAGGRCRIRFGREEPRLAGDQPYGSKLLKMRLARTGRDRKFADSPLEEAGFEPSVPPVTSSVGAPCHSVSGEECGTGADAAFDRAFSCSANHSMEPGANTVLMGGGLRRRSSSSAR
jgi:NAD(P)-dependent dehydrogenase (short-subunit alcohol dehydrogenase family)